MEGRGGDGGERWRWREMEVLTGMPSHTLAALLTAHIAALCPGGLGGGAGVPSGHNPA